MFNYIIEKFKYIKLNKEKYDETKLTKFNDVNISCKSCKFCKYSKINCGNHYIMGYRCKIKNIPCPLIGITYWCKSYKSKERKKLFDNDIFKI